MADESSLPLPQDLNQQLARIIGLSDLLQSELQKVETPDSPQVIQCLTLLTKNLNMMKDGLAYNSDELKSLRALADISQIVNSTLELNEVLRIVMDTIIGLTGAERGFLMLRDKTGELSTRIARNWEQESLDASEFAISRTIINRVVAEGSPVLTTNAQEDPRFSKQNSIIVYNLRSILCVPLIVKGDITGVMYADNRIRAGLFTDKERDLLVAFSHQAAEAIENARLFDSVKHSLDEVTELKNLMTNIFSSMVSGVITTDIEDNVLLCNRAAQLILNRSASELIGHDLEEIFQPIAPGLMDYVRKARDDNRYIVGREFLLEIPSRGMVTLSIHLSPLKDAMQVTQGVAIVLDDLTDKKRLEGQRKLFERMVSPKVIHQLDPEKIQLGGNRMKITTLFADIRGFTSFGESREPEQLVGILNRYLAAAAEAILEQEGTIDKFMGDAIMAWFNAPILQPDHTLRSIRAALGIQQAIKSLHSNLDDQFRLSFGIGIHYGEAVLGLIGSERQVEYTAIGDSVNTAKRIQENAQAGQILVSEAVYKQIQDEVHARRVEPIYAKGKREPVEVYEILGLF